MTWEPYDDDNAKDGLFVSCLALVVFGVLLIMKLMRGE